MAPGLRPRAARRQRPARSRGRPAVRRFRVAACLGSGDDPASLDAWVHEHLRRADADVARLVAVKGVRTVANTLRPYDDANNELVLAAAQARLLYGVGATQELRDKAQALTQSANAALTALSLNPPVYRALAALPRPADAATRHYLERTLLEYRLAGVDRDDATRAKIKALQDKITELGLAFERAVHDDVRTVVADKAQLDGLPQDYLAAHPADADGHVKITTDPPDSWPAQRFANNAELRHELFLAANSVGYPANSETLRGLLAARAELAQLLGYRHLGGPGHGRPDDRLARQPRASISRRSTPPRASRAHARTRRCSRSRASATPRSRKSPLRMCATGRSNTGARNSTSTPRACVLTFPTRRSSAA